jgi:hypothetical protein
MIARIASPRKLNPSFLMEAPRVAANRATERQVGFLPQAREYKKHRIVEKRPLP